jgi:hypothetical protein
MYDTTTDVAGVVAHYATKCREDLEMRDRAICAMRADGASLGDIAALSGLSRQGIAKIVQRNTDCVEAHSDDVTEREQQ